ncbi:MAG: SpaH/EbpB family LPXTG-anchored major pilin [Clostridia bacterium]|nr:SpaH/EbpB family LPXTG-anchored major pilin [Clostridia bacterium]
MIVFVAVPHVSAAEAEITEDDTYVLNRDGNGEQLYQYQSPCLIGYDLDNKYGGNGVPIQAFIFTMYNSVTGEHFPTYCSDINIAAVQGTSYRRLNLEDSSFSGNSAGRVRAILQKGFYIIPIDGESDADHAARVNAKAAELAQAAGIENLTVGEAIAATQTAIWQVIHGSVVSFPRFCRSVFNPRNTKYGSLCSYNELRSKNIELINTTIKAVYDYLLSLEPVAATEKTVSPASFTDLQDPVLVPNTDGTYNISVTTTVDVDMSSGDSLTLRAALNDDYYAETELSANSSTVTLTIRNVPAKAASGDVTLSISGYQTAEGFFFFDAVGGRQTSQAMVGYNNSRLPVYAEVVAQDERILNIYKTANVAVGDDSYERKPLSNIAFDIFPITTMDEYLTGNVDLPDATEYSYPDLAEYTLITDENGKASMNFLHHGLPDGVYLVVERRHPSIVSPIDPFYLFVPMTDPETSQLVYEITVQPKNDVKGDIRIEKDVISIGNDEASVNAYEPHTWIIGTTVPEDISGGKSFVITDTLDNRLDYVGDIKVMLEEINGAVTPVELIKGTDYKLTVTDVDSLSEDKPSDSFEIKLTGSGMSKISKAIGTKAFGNYMLRVYFDAQINANAQITEQIPNRAELEYTNAAGIEFEKESDIPYVYTGAINLLKVDATDKNITLPGAVFEIYRSATDKEVGAGDSRLTEIPVVAGKVIKESFFNNNILEGDKVSSVTSDKDGKVAIYGLAYGKYYLVETQAPTGYNLIAQPIELTINGSSHLEGNEVSVLNTTGTLLPETGGIGTAPYIVGGILLMAAACLILYNRRKTAKT